MSERYSRLFSLSENLYAVGSPVVIAAGTLLKDNQTGKIVAQLKMRSISSKTIIGTKVRLHLFDNAGKPIGDPVDFDYLDLRVIRDAEFGQKTPVPVPEKKARAYKADVQEVVFADKTTWTASDTEWEPLPRQKTLDAVLVNAELVKQYKIAVGSNFAYYPLEEKDLWYCTCGALNHENENCHACHRSLFELQTIDLEQLAKDRDARLAQEAADAAAKAAAEKAAAEATKKKTAKILKIVIPALCAVVAVTLLTTKIIIPNSKYNKAVSLMEAGQYEDAIDIFHALKEYKDAPQMIVNATKQKDNAEQETAYQKAVAQKDAGNYGQAAISFQKLGDYRDSKEQSIALWDQLTNKKIIATGYKHSIGLNKDGTVVATGGKSDGQCNVSDWKDIVSIDAENGHTVGLKADGTVLAVGYNDDGQCNVSKWTDIVDIAAGSFQTIGLAVDGTVVAVGWNDHGQCNVSNWTDIVAISAGGYHTVGVKADGTVVAVGNNEKGQCNVSGWTNIIAVVAGKGHTAGLKADGTVIATGWNDYGQCNVSDWTDIVAISADNGQTVGLKADGTVVAVGYNEYGQCDTETWTNIIAVAAGSFHTIGLKADGSVVAVGWNNDGQCNVSSWKNIKLPN